MTQVLIVDDASALAELFAEAIRAQLGYDVAVAVALDAVDEALESIDQLDLALVDLSFPQEDGTGIDALVNVQRTKPTARLAIITQGDAWVANVLRDAWELLPITTVISKSAPLGYQLAAIDQVITTGGAPVDPAIQPLLPEQRPARRTVASFSWLVQHGGHAKFWRALLSTHDPTYKDLSDRSGLKLNTVKNYRAQLLPELAVHGLSDPSLREMGEFAHRCRPFFEPFLHEQGQP